MFCKTRVTRLWTYLINEYDKTNSAQLISLKNNGGTRVYMSGCFYLHTNRIFVQIMLNQREDISTALEGCLIVVAAFRDKVRLSGEFVVSLLGAFFGFAASVVEVVSGAVLCFSLYKMYLFGWSFTLQLYVFVAGAASEVSGEHLIADVIDL